MAINQYYVSAATGDDTTGDGSIGNPWATIQKALDTIVKDTVNGDQINIQSTTKQTLAAPLSLTVYGTPGMYGRLGLRGYTLTAGDGGMAEIDCNGATMWAATTYDNISLAYLDCYNSGNNHLVNIRNNIWLFRCRAHEVGGNDKNPIRLSVGGSVIGCHVYNYSLGGGNTAQGVSLAGGLVAYTRIEGGANGRTGIYSGPSLVTALGNLILLDRITGVGIYGVVNNNLTALGNVIINRTGGTGTGIQSGGTVYSSGPIMNNLVTGFSGVGGKAFDLGPGPVQVAGYNALWNNTATYAGDGEVEQDLRANDILLADDPFVNAAAGDFRLTDAAKALLRSAGWPPTYLDSTLDPHITIGAVQYGEAAGGGGGPVIGSRIIRGLGAV